MYSKDDIKNNQGISKILIIIIVLVILLIIGVVAFILLNNISCSLDICLYNKKEVEK